MTRKREFQRCLVKQFAEDQALLRAMGPGSCIFLPSDLKCAMRLGVSEQERRAWSRQPSFGQAPRGAEEPDTITAILESPVPPAMIGIAMGSLAWVVGSFVFALVAPKQDLGIGALYAAGPSIAAGTAAAYIHATNPALSARIVKASTGTRLASPATAQVQKPE